MFSVTVAVTVAVAVAVAFPRLSLHGGITMTVAVAVRLLLLFEKVWIVQCVGDEIAVVFQETLQEIHVGLHEVHEHRSERDRKLHDYGIEHAYQHDQSDGNGRRARERHERLRRAASRREQVFPSHVLTSMVVTDDSRTHEWKVLQCETISLFLK